MRWLKFGVLLLLILLGAYAVSMYYFVDESRSVRVRSDINYPTDKVFEQFSNLQNFARWNTYFSEDKKLSVQFYAPYEGQGASMSFGMGNRSGEFVERFVNPGKGIKYQLFESEKGNPTIIDVKFKAIDASRTEIEWLVHSPKQPLLKRYLNILGDESFAEHIPGSITNLGNILSNRVDKESLLAAIKYDSLMVEDQKGGLLLGVNVSASTRRDALIKNIVLNHNKVYNFVTNDLGKRDEEFGLPVMISDPSDIKNKEISYFYGVPLSKRIGVSDNNFSFRSISPGRAYVIYFKGNFQNRGRAVQQLLQRAKHDTMRANSLQETFLEAPQDGGDVNLKIALPVYR